MVGPRWRDLELNSSTLEMRIILVSSEEGVVEWTGFNVSRLLSYEATQTDQGNILCLVSELPSKTQDCSAF